jgi:hypothetical protein
MTDTCEKHCEATAFKIVIKGLESEVFRLKKEPPPLWPVVQNLLDEYGLQFIDVVAAYREATQPKQEPVIFCMHWEDRWGCNHYADPKEPHPADAKPLYAHPPQHIKQEPVSMRMPKVGDRVICIEDESLGVVRYLTGGGSPDITFDDGSHGTYLLQEFAKLFAYATPPATFVQLEQEPMTRTEWNKRIRDSVDSLLAKAGYEPESSARLQLDMMNFDTLPASQPPQRKPLTDEDVISIAYDCNVLPEVITDETLLIFVRGIETAHGITKESP